MHTSQPVAVAPSPIWLTVLTMLAEAPASVEDDITLVRRAQNDNRYFNELYERHVNQVYRYLLVRVGNVDDAQDLTSQTFLAALENIEKYRGQSPFAAWLIGIARHKMMDQYRRRRPEAELETADHIADSHEQPDTIVSRQLQIETVARKLQTIAPDRAEAITLRLFSGLEVAEIARLMGKQEPAVRMLIHRGLRDLRAQLNPDQEELL